MYTFKYTYVIIFTKDVSFMEKTTKIFGYVRVSSKDQNLARQIDSLKNYVPDERDIFTDKLSGKDFDRPGYQSLKYTLRSGDTLYIHSLDRLGRNKADVKDELQALANKGVIVRVLDIPTSLMDYSQFGSLQKSIMEMVNNILIEVLATMAESERVRIKERQKEGIAAAHARNVKFGRPLKELPAEFAEDYQEWKAGKTTAVALMKKYNISKTCYYNKVKEYE